MILLFLKMLQHSIEIKLQSQLINQLKEAALTFHNYVFYIHVILEFISEGTSVFTSHLLQTIVSSIDFGA